jgi:hypothetical protein
LQRLGTTGSSMEMRLFSLEPKERKPPARVMLIHKLKACAAFSTP